jgi:hypothetical protein
MKTSSCSSTSTTLTTEPKLIECSPTSSSSANFLSPSKLGKQQINPKQKIQNVVKRSPKAAGLALITELSQKKTTKKTTTKKQKQKKSLSTLSPRNKRLQKTSTNTKRSLKKLSTPLSQSPQSPISSSSPEITLSDITVNIPLVSTIIPAIAHLPVSTGSSSSSLSSTAAAVTTSNLDSILRASDSRVPVFLSDVNIHDLKFQLKKATIKFEKACRQLIMLDQHINDLQNSYSNSLENDRKTFKIVYRMQLATLEGTHNAYIEYIERQVEKIKKLKRLLFNENVQNLNTSFNNSIIAIGNTTMAAATTTTANTTGSL